MKKIKIFILYFILTICFSTFVIPLYNGDEMWNYGFSYNIATGLIPYKDFSMLQTPLYFYIGSIFIKIFGNYLFSLHIFDALFISGIMLMLHDMIGKKSLLLYPLFVIVLVPSYNFLCLFFLFLIIYLIFKNKDNDLLVAFIVGLIFMTKQSVGVTMFIPMFYYSKNKFKSILYFLLPFTCFSLYFLFNDAFFEFFDHSFLGMIDFGEKNSMITVLTYIEVVEVIFILYKLFKEKFTDKVLFYILAFQILSYPIFEAFHWLIAAIPFIYYLLMSYNYKSFLKIDYLLVFIITIGSCIAVMAVELFFCFSYLDDMYIETENNYLFLRNMAIANDMELDQQKFLIEKYGKDVDYKFFIMVNAYFRKLYMDMEINEFDLLLNGNMGYNGDDKKISKINKICENNSCVFFVESSVFEGENYSQLSEKIYKFVINNYTKIVDDYHFDIYVN